jgi:DNA polymerase-3 subunit gamma/tau
MDPRAGEFTGLLPEEVEQVAAQAQKFTPRRLLDLMERLQEGGAALRWNTQPRVLLEMTLAGFLVDPVPSLEELARRVEELEGRLAALVGRGEVAAGREPAAGRTGEPVGGGTHDRSHAVAAMKAPRRSADRPGVAPLPADQAGPEPGKLARPVAGGAWGADKDGGPGEPGLEISEVLERWPEVLAAARRESVHLQAYLRAGEPVAVRGSSLTLEVKTDFHRGMLEQPANRQKVEAVLARVFSRPLKLVITAGRPPEGGVEREVLDKLVEYFGPDKVEIKD